MSETVHFVGIGGVGMSALAQTYLDHGYRVTGSDRCLREGGFGMTGVLKALASQGVALGPDDGKLVTRATSMVIYSTAIEEDNADWLAAKAQGITLKHRAVALRDVLAGKKLVCVVGTCGKSTVTAMLGHMLAEVGFDPTVVNGAQIVGWDEGGTRVGSVRKGREGGYAVLEVDESDRSLEVFNPYAVVVTNASADHFSKEEMDSLFDAIKARAAAPEKNVEGRVMAGAADEAAVRDIRKYLKMPGKHNVQNASLAMAMAMRLGADARDVLNALATFPGVDRRLQYVGKCGTTVVYDDYAHNPEKLSAMWQAVREAHAGVGICVCWRPHGYGPLRKMREALAAAFRQVMLPEDRLVLLPVYDAGGTAVRDVRSEDLAADIGAQAMCVKDLNEAEEVLRKQASAFGVIVTAGARDPGLPVLARKLVGKE